MHLIMHVHPIKIYRLSHLIKKWRNYQQTHFVLSHVYSSCSWVQSQQLQMILKINRYGLIINDYQVFCVPIIWNLNLIKHTWWYNIIHEGVYCLHGITSVWERIRTNVSSREHPSRVHRGKVLINRFIHYPLISYN